MIECIPVGVSTIVIAAGAGGLLAITIFASGLAINATRARRIRTSKTTTTTTTTPPEV